MNSLTLTLIIIHFAWIFLLLRISCGRKTLSPFYSKSEFENEEMEYEKNTYRKNASKNFLHSLRENASIAFHINSLGKPSIDHLIVIITKNPADYKSDKLNKYVLTQLVTSIDKSIREDDSESTAMLICNRSSTSFKEMEELSKFYPIYNARFSHPSRHLKMTEEEKLKIDFIDCVKLALSVTEPEPKYVTVISDVVVPYEQFLPTLKYIIFTKLDNRISRGELSRNENNSWFCLHLQEPVNFRAFTFDVASFVDLLLVIFSGAFVFFAYYKLVESKFRPFQNSPKTLALFVCYGSFLFLVLALVVGRPYLTELRRMSPSLYRLYEPPEPIAVSAVTMLSECAIRMSNHLSGIVCSNYSPFKDTWFHAMYSFENPGFVVSPSLVRYV